MISKILTGMELYYSLWFVIVCRILLIIQSSS